MKTLHEHLTAGVAAFMTERGYAVEQTGGGCTAWSKATKLGGYVLVCNDLSHEFSTDLETGWSAGEYDKDGETIPHDANNDGMNLEDAEALASGYAL